MITKEIDRITERGLMKEIEIEIEVEEIIKRIGEITRYKDQNKNKDRNKEINKERKKDKSKKIIKMMKKVEEIEIKEIEMIIESKKDMIKKTKAIIMEIIVDKIN